MTFDDVLNIVAQSRREADREALFTVVGRKGMAWRYVCMQETACELCDGYGQTHEQERDSEGDVIDLSVDCERCDGAGEHCTGMVLLHMVGDRSIHAFDPTELVHYTGDVCSCGQVGCEWH